MCPFFDYLLQQNNKPFTIIHSLDGYDEISLTNDTKVITQSGERIATPEELGKRTVTPQDISGGNTVEEAAKKRHESPEGKAAAKRAEEENEAATEGERLKREGKVP